MRTNVFFFFFGVVVFTSLDKKMENIDLDERQLLRRRRDVSVSSYSNVIFILHSHFFIAD